jgi:uncharacterized protein (TIGR02646 family)
MKHIVKGSEPQSLLEYKLTPNATYNGFGSKEDVRIALIKEQKGLCAYCNGRISNDWNKELGKPKTGIEHYKSREEHSHLQLEYANMLGVCNGVSTDSNNAVQHCDTSRGSKALTIDPLSISCEKSISYSTDGKIKSTNTAIQSDFDDILKLNISLLKRERRSLVDLVVKKLNRTNKNQSWTKAVIQKEINFWKQGEKVVDDIVYLKPYCQVAIHYLNNKLSRL